MRMGFVDTSTDSPVSFQEVFGVEAWEEACYAAIRCVSFKNSGAAGMVAGLRKLVEMGALELDEHVEYYSGPRGSSDVAAFRKKRLVSKWSEGELV